MTVHINDYSKKLNPTFFEVWLSDKPNRLLKGGRSGTKSSVISQALVKRKMQYPMANVMSFRQQANTLQMSVYNQIAWALDDAGVADQFTFRKNPMTILHKRWGTGFYFGGMDDPQKVKGIKIAKGYISDLWFEECDSLRGIEEIDTVQDTFLRAINDDGVEVRTWMSYNPPKNQYHWINEWVETIADDPDWIIHHSTYLDDVRGYNSPQIIRKIERYKINDLNYYNWMYRGIVTGMGDNVYNMDTINIVDEIPEGEHLVGLCMSTDTGHMVSATTTLCFGLTNKGNVVLLDLDYYNPTEHKKKRTAVGHSKRIYEFTQACAKKYNVPIYQKTIDSADGAVRNQYFDMYGEYLHPVKKGKKVDMIDYFQDLLAQGRFYVLNTDNNQIFIEEHKRYRWDEKSLERNPENPSVIKVDDHTCDAAQYFAVDNKRLLNLKLKK